MRDPDGSVLTGSFSGTGKVKSRPTLSAKARKGRPPVEVVIGDGRFDVPTTNVEDPLTKEEERTQPFANGAKGWANRQAEKMGHPRTRIPRFRA